MGVGGGRRGRSLMGSAVCRGTTPETAVMSSRGAGGQALQSLPSEDGERVSVRREESMRVWKTRGLGVARGEPERRVGWCCRFEEPIQGGGKKPWESNVQTVQMPLVLAKNHTLDCA